MAVSRHLRTARLHLTAASRQDAPVIAAAIAASQAELRRWFTWAQGEPSTAACRERCEKAEHNFETGAEYCFHLWLAKGEPTAAKAFAGKVNLVSRASDVPLYELGYWLRSDLAGQGLAAEAVGAVRALAFRELAAERLEIRSHAANQRSQRLALRLGFVFEGRLRNQRRDPAGRLADTLVYAQLRREWQG